MKKVLLNQTGNFVVLSGVIDESYMVFPGHKITFGAGSIFKGVVIDSGTIFCNDEYVVKKFALNVLGQIQLTSASEPPTPGLLLELMESKDAMNDDELNKPSAPSPLPSGVSDSGWKGPTPPPTPHHLTPPAAVVGLWVNTGSRGSSSPELPEPITLATLPSSGSDTRSLQPMLLPPLMIAQLSALPAADSEGSAAPDPSSPEFLTPISSAISYARSTAVHARGLDEQALSGESSEEPCCPCCSSFCAIL